MVQIEKIFKDSFSLINCEFDRIHVAQYSWVGYILKSYLSYYEILTKLHRHENAKKLQ